MNVLTLEDKYPRSVLIEGRSYGIAYAMCKRDGDKVLTVGPISPCREYLNDQMGTEINEKPCGAYGYKAKYEGLLKADKLYVAVAILPNHGGSEYHGQKEETERMSADFKCYEKFINHFEELLKVEGRTIIHKVADNRYVMEVPKWWGKWTYLMSLHSFLLRVAMEASYKDGDPYEFFKKANKTTDANYVPGVLTKIDKLRDGIIPAQNLSNTYWHGCGIVNQSF